MKYNALGCVVGVVITFFVLTRGLHAPTIDSAACALLGGLLSVLFFAACRN